MSALPCEEFWKDQRVLVTGHTGFEGGWAVAWFLVMGAEVGGYSLPPPQGPSMFEALGLYNRITSVYGDLRDADSLRQTFEAFRPTVVLHLGAQPSEDAAYDDPVSAYATNVMGLVNVLELARAHDSVRATVVATSDCCYEPQDQIWPHRETDRLGGRDPHSNSKACAELVVSGYWWSYFRHLKSQGLATARAGNVMGGGDWSRDRLIPRLISAFGDGQVGTVQEAESVRPWQHVLEPVCGYLRAAEHISRNATGEAPRSWNFGPDASNNVMGKLVARKLACAWGEGAKVAVEAPSRPARQVDRLTLDSSKAEDELAWRPRWDLDRSVEATVDWYRAFNDGADMFAFTRSQLEAYADA